MLLNGLFAPFKTEIDRKKIVNNYLRLSNALH